METILYVYLGVMSVITFFMYGYDKRCAIKNKWRVPESHLILLGFLGGALGAILGMKIFHHKTQKLKFKVFVPVSLILWVAVLVYFIVIR